MSEKTGLTAIEFARSLGVPVPKVLSYEDDGPNTDGSTWMTIVPDVPANIWWPKRHPMDVLRSSAN